MRGRVGRRAVVAIAGLVVASVGAGVGVGATPSPAGARAERAERAEAAERVAQDGRQLTVTPSTGLSAGDTVTVSGSGLVPGAPVSLGGCAAEVIAAPDEAEDHCDLYIPTRESLDGRELVTDELGAFSTEVSVGSPAWEAVIVLVPWDLEVTAQAAAPIEVTPPPAPEVVAAVDRSEVIAGIPPEVSGWVWPAPAEEYGVRALPCTTVPEPAGDRAAIEAACGPLTGGSPLVTSSTGAFRYWVPIEPGTVALWVGREDGGVPLGDVVPVAVVPTPPAGTLSVTPTTGLLDQQRLRVTGTAWPRAVGFVEVQVCAAGATVGQPCVGGHLVDPRADGTIDAEVIAYIEVMDPDGGPDPVRCDSAPGACELVASLWADPSVRAAPVPLEFASVPPVVPVVLPQAATVAEGDDGTTTAEVPVVLSQPTRVPVTVAYQTFDAPALAWTATSGQDHTATSGTLTFAPGETTATIPIAINGDTDVEVDEMALVAVTDPVGATIGGFGGIGGAVITNDD